MLSTLILLAHEHLHRAAGLQNRNYSVGIFIYNSVAVWKKSALPTTWIGASRSTMWYFGTNPCTEPSPAFEPQVYSCLLVLPQQLTLFQALPGQLVKKQTTCFFWWWLKKGWHVQILRLAPEPPPCLQHLLPPDLDREDSTQTHNILCNLHPRT